MLNFKYMQKSKSMKNKNSFIFNIKVSNDINIEIVTNLDFGRIPVELGKSIAVCGEFKKIGQGMVHWTHFDPHGGHADGFTILDGALYGDVETGSHR